MQPFIWKFLTSPPKDEIQALSRKLATHENFPEALATILLQRGINSYNQAEAYLKPDHSGFHSPFLMKEMDRAATRIAKAIKTGERILLYGDYDVDGTSSVSLCAIALSLWGANFDYYIPDRYTEGYGLSFKGIDYARQNGSGLLITLDCGTKAVEKVAYANQHKIEVIICDHHTPGEILPPAFAMVNPRQIGCEYPFKDLPACGIAYKLMEATQYKLLESNHIDDSNTQSGLFDLLSDLVALSVCCDIVPMVGENRLFTWYGLQKLRKNPLPGLGALKRLSENEREWSVSDVVFFLGPRINSAGRLNHATAAVRLLLGDNEELTAFAQNLQQSNNDRKALDLEITDAACTKILTNPGEIERYSTVLYDPDWHKGVIGIVASRLIERFYRPTILLTRSGDLLVGSGRSVEGFDLYDALSKCAHHLVQFGGHKYAAGLTLKEEDFGSFRDCFEEEVKNKLTDEQKQPALEIASRLDFSEVNDRFVRLLGYLAPFGPHNLDPVFWTSGVEVIDYRILKTDHLKLSLKQGEHVFEAIGFGLAEKWNASRPLEMDIAFQLSFKTWRGKTTIQLQLKDFKSRNE